MAYKKFKDLDLSNGFLFSAALADEDTCQLVLELILGRPVGKLRVHAEHAILFSSDFRSVRLDIYAEESGELEVKHDLEMQSKDTGNLPKRVRFYQAELDVGGLKPGENFDALKPTYIVFICNFDPFGEQCYRYTLEKRWKETGKPYEDGTHVIFLSTKGENADEVPRELVHFLKYLEHSTEEVANDSEDNRIWKLHDKLEQLKASSELEGRYMTLEDWLQDELQERLEAELQVKLQAELEKREEQLQTELQKREEQLQTELQKREEQLQTELKDQAEALREEGRREGTISLIKLIQKKMLKRKNIAQIAEDLEESEESLRPICEAIQKCGINADPAEIYEAIQR